MSRRARELGELRHKADHSPHDSRMQAMLLSALNRAGQRHEAIQRFESGHYAVDVDVAREYVRALVAEGRVPEAEFDYAVSQALHPSPPPHPSYPSHAPPPPPSYASHAYSSQLPHPHAQSTHPHSFPPPAFPTPPASSSASTEPPGTEANPLVVRALSGGGAWAWFGRLLNAAFWATVLYMLFFRRGSSGGGGPLDALTGGTPPEPAEVPETKFSDVKGVDEAKAELEDVVRFLREPERFTKLGAKVPKGVLLTGPPGTGKTLLARAVAGEAGVRFYAKSASEFEEMLVGLGARRVRDVFAQARANAPAIIFIDEIDAMGAKRGRVALGSGSERQTLNQLLACMDGFTKTDNVIVIAATNNPEVLDAALTRPGRFDSKVNVPLPDIKGRAEILDLYLGRVRASQSVDVDVLAAATPGMSGAMLEALVNQAALIAANAGVDEVGPDELEEARDKVWMGPAMRSRKRTEEEMELTAWHEGGHTLAGLLTRGARDLHKVTILARGQAGGVTFFLDDDDNLMTREKILAQIDVAMGGRVAEEIKYGPLGVTTGAGSDMQQASQYARMYVKSFSMGSLGLTTFDESDPRSSPSSETQKLIDAEVESLLRESHARVTKLLTSNKHKLEALANALITHETLTADDCRRVIRGETLPPPAELARARRAQFRRKIEGKAAADDTTEQTTGVSSGGMLSWFTGSSEGAGEVAVEPPQSSSPSPQPPSTPKPKPTKPNPPSSTADDDSEDEKEQGGTGKKRKWQ